MFPIRVKTVQESDLRMLGSLARNIQRVLPVTQADIDAAAALGKGWVVWKVFEVSDPLDNLRGGTQLIIRQNSIQPGQNVRRVIFVSGPGGQTVVIRGTDYIVLPDAIANSLSYVKAFGETEQRNLPDRYIERQFIYMMDGSYLLTNIVPTYDCKIEMDFQTTTTAGSPVTYLGARTDTTDGAGLRLGHITNKKFRIYGFGGSQDSTYAATNDTRYKYVWDNQRATITSGSTTVLDQTFTDTGTTTDYLAINAWNTNGSITGNVEGIYLYSFKMWDNQGELIADYVPAVQKGTVPVVGFYDTVSGTFKTATAGTFAAGAEAVPTPDAPMDIVSNNGALAFRDTELPTAYRRILGMTMNDNCYYEITGFKMNGSDTLRFSFTRTGGNACNVLGAYDGSSSQKNYSLYAGASSSANYLRYNGGTYNSYAIANKKYDVVLTPTGSDGMENDSTWTAKTFTSTTNLFIGTTSPAATSSKMVGSIHGTVVVDGRLELIPCERVSDSEIGYYDPNTGTFYEPIGTTPISLGYDYTHCDIMADGTVETIGVHSKNLFDPTIASYESFGVTGPATNIRYGHIYRNGTYTIKQNVSGTQIYVKLVSGGSYGTALTITTARTLTVSGDDMILVYAGSPTPKDVTEYEVQVERGTSATEYQPYFDGGTATAEMLLKVGDYQDEQEILSGAITRNVGVKVLDGTENDYAKRSDYAINYTGLTGRAYSNGIYGMCSHFVCSASNASTAPVGSLLFNMSNSYLHFFTEFGGDVTSFKAWLAAQYAAGTPVIVVYPLETPTTESVTGQTLQVTDGDNVLEITQASLTGLELEAEYNAAVSLTIQEVEDANLDNNVEVTIQ